MAVYDWDHDGKKGIVDDYLEYNIFKESTKNSGSNGGFLGMIFIIFFVFYVIIYLFGDLFEPKRPCMAIGCMEERSGSSIYCTEHRLQYE